MNPYIGVFPNPWGNNENPIKDLCKTPKNGALQIPFELWVASQSMRFHKASTQSELHETSIEGSVISLGTWQSPHTEGALQSPLGLIQMYTYKHISVYFPTDMWDALETA